MKTNKIVVTNKIDVLNFNKTNMTAKLFCILHNFDNDKDNLLENRQIFDNSISKTVNDNFTFDQKYKEIICSHLSLFLLGKQDNLFSKAIQ